MEKREPAPAAPSRRPPRPRFRIGDVLSSTFSVWGRNLGTLLLLMAIAYSPWLAYSVYRLAEPAPDAARSAEDGSAEEPAEDPAEEPWEMVWRQLGSWETWREPLFSGVAQSFLGYLAQAVVVFAVFRRLREERATVAESLRGGLRRFPAVLGASLLVSLFSLAPWAGLVALAAGVWGGGLTGMLAILVAVPFAAAASIWVTLVLWVAVPAVVVERLGVGAALRRSAELTRGHRLAIFLLTMIVGLIGAAAGGIAGTFRAFVPTVGTLLVLGMTLAAGALAATLATVGYQTLREEKEGARLPDLLEVFA